MFEFNSVTAPFLITGVMASLLMVGVILRRFVPFFRKTLLPASIIAGLLGFILTQINWKSFAFPPHFDYNGR